MERPYNILDAQKERNRKFEIAKEKLLDLTEEYLNCMTDDHPARRKQNQEKSHKLFYEMWYRLCDIDVFRYDMRNDWELNYDDYDE